DGRVVVQHVQGRQNQNQRNFARGNGAAGNGGAQNRVGDANAGQEKPIKCYNCNGLGHITRNCTQPKRPHNSNYFKDKMLLMQAQENGAVLDEEELLFMAGEQTNTFNAYVDNQPVRDLALNEDNIFQADECDAFDSDVDDEPTTQSIFMANLSSARLANLQAGPSNASILSEVHDLENAIDPSDNHQVEHEIHDEVQQKNIIKSTSADMGNSNVIPYEQYLTVNNVFVVPSSASSVPNDAYVLHDNDAYVPPDPLATDSISIRNKLLFMNNTLNRNKKEENLKKELHFVKLQLNSTIQNNKIIEETITALKQEFKQKESKFLSDFSNLKNLKDKLENKLYSQDQPIQTVHMMLKPTKLYDQDAVTAIGVQNPFYLRKAKKAQPTLYDGDKLLKTHHVPDVFYTATDFVMNASRFHELSTAYNVVMNRVIAHLNLQLKYQHLKENLNNFKSKSSKDVPEFDAFFELGKPDDQIQGHKNTFRKLKAQISQLKANKSDEMRHLDYKSLDSQNLQLKETVTSLQERLENFKADNEKVKQHYQELFVTTMT
ncbi:retrovirus-related pol polyprotein from transposon TNT 1-94, partial [Tanacetum coccineum]